MSQTPIESNNGGGLWAVSTMKRVALYMRVSTKSHGQNTETQALALRDYAGHRDFQIVEEYRDEGISGSKDSRPALDRLMKDARARKFDVVIVARFDRFARSVSHLLRALEEFNHLGIDFVSLSESIDTSTPMGKMIFTVLGAVAALERNLIKERVHMGISRARKEGKSLGRPKRIFDREKARTMLGTMSAREVARQVGCQSGSCRACGVRESKVTNEQEKREAGPTCRSNLAFARAPLLKSQLSVFKLHHNVSATCPMFINAFLQV